MNHTQFIIFLFQMYSLQLYRHILKMSTRLQHHCITVQVIPIFEKCKNSSLSVRNVTKTNSLQCQFPVCNLSMSPKQLQNLVCFQLFYFSSKECCCHPTFLSHKPARAMQDFRSSRQLLDNVCAVTTIGFK